MKNNNPDKNILIESELYELSMPGKIIGKEIFDNRARRIGIVRNIRLSLAPLKVELIVKGLEVEFPIDIQDVETVGSVIQLKTIAKEAEEIDIRDVIRLQKEVWDDIRSYLKFNE